MKYLVIAIVIIAAIFIVLFWELYMRVDSLERKVFVRHLFSQEAEKLAAEATEEDSPITDISTFESLLNDWRVRFEEEDNEDGSLTVYIDSEDMDGTYDDVVGVNFTKDGMFKSFGIYE